MKHEVNHQTLIEAAFDSESMRSLAQCGIVRRYPKRSIIINEGDQGGTLLLIAAGRVRVFSSIDGEREFVHGIYGPGEYVGEFSLDGGPRSASVRTIEPSVCISIDHSVLLAHLRQHPEFALELLTRVISRVRIATGNATVLALLDSYGRIARLLNDLAVNGASGDRIIPEKLTHREIASRVGTSREMVSRILKDLIDGDYLQMHDQRLCIKKDLPSGW